MVENDPAGDVRRLGDWLTEAGVELAVVRPHAGEALPAGEDELSGYGGLLVLGGGADEAPWYQSVEGLLRTAVQVRVPTLAICLGAQLMATALGGYVEPAQAGPEIGPQLVAKRDAAGNDPLFGPVPLLPDVIQWHRNEVTELPPGATLLAASPRYPHQAFRYGDRAWALQFHVECDMDMLRAWAAEDPGLADADVAELLERCAAALPDVAEVWRPFAHRYADLVLGRLDPARIELPLLDT